MKTTEQEILSSIQRLKLELDDASKVLRQAKRAVCDAESIYIGAKLSFEKEQERYRIFKNQQVRVSHEASEDDKELERFRQLLPELLKKV